MASEVLDGIGRPQSRGADGRGPSPAPPGGPDPGDGQGANPDTGRIGLWAFLGTVTMLFLGFTSAYILRRSSTDWVPLRVPSLLALSTAILLASSVAVELARRRLRGWDPAGALRLLGAAGLCGAGFIAAQLGAWRQLADAGVFLATNPHSSFFYVLTGVHVVHVMGGLGWFILLVVRLRRMAVLPGSDGLGLFATYWHFLGGLWLYLLGLLFLY